jgi:inositol-pentakisphosphate 2-kinase
MSAAPTDYTIGEMGELVKVPQTSDQATGSVAKEPAKLSTDQVAVSGGEVSGAGATQPALSSETNASDWRYLGEGGAHVLLAYHGSSIPWAKRVLRIKKRQSASNDVTEQVATMWRDELLPKIFPAGLLASAKKVDVDAGWLKELVKGLEKDRPQSRKDENDLTSLGQVYVMENLIGEVQDGAKVFAVEIKVRYG